MPNQQPLKLLFIYNPISGGHHEQSIWTPNPIQWEEQIISYLDGLPHSYTVFKTTAQNDHQSIRAIVKKISPDRIAAIGGDGTLKMVVEATKDIDIPICIFPAGSANGMARELQMPLTAEGCMEVLLTGTVKPVDAILINQSHLCIHLSDIGINAQLVKYFEENDIRGKWGYAKEIFRVLWRRRLMNVQITSEKHSIQRKAFMVVIANASQYGTGARINPLGNVHDGIFEVVILRKLSITELFKMLFLNRKFNPEKTEVLQAQRLHIEVKRKIYFQVDGEYLGKTKSITAEVKPHIVKLIFPS
ncbi:MAG TPA: diacylglycerol kinase family protein [Flavipsychrobacter sp.]|nr:diacylglycerol kinase family protein [Flavipsychrobacter sp.]